MTEKELSKDKIYSINNLLEELSNTKKIKNLEIFRKELIQIKEKSEKIQLSIIQKFIILFYSYYNNLEFKYQSIYTSKLIQLANNMINNFNNPNILNLIQSEINQNFNEEFKNYKIFSDEYKEKDCYEICFSLCILSKNIELMIIFFSKYLKVSLFDEEDKYNSLNLNNPITGTLFNSLFINLYKEIKNKKMNNLDSIITNCFKESNIFLNNMLRCDKCYEIKMIKLSTNNNFFFLKCSNCDKKYIESTEFQVNDTIYLNINCTSCSKKILLYEENCKCTRCKSLFCPKCINDHFKHCFTLNYIKLYEVGYKCEIILNIFHIVFSAKKIYV